MKTHEHAQKHIALDLSTYWWYCIHGTFMCGRQFTDDEQMGRR